LGGVARKTREAIVLCERVLAMQASVKLHATTRAALCFLLRNSGQTDKALAIAQKLPHVWECREFVLPDDVKAVAAPVLAHRIISRSQSSARVTDASENIIDYIIDTVPAPIE
jgi:MoxR-like ATPase